MGWLMPSASSNTPRRTRVPPALAVHRPCRGKAGGAVAEFVSAREPARVQLRVSARQPAGIAILRRRLVGKGRESHDLRTCAPPTIENMWIDEGESSILRECDARSGRRKGRCLLCLS